MRDDLKDLPPTISVEQAAKLLGISRNSAWAAIERGELETVRFGRRVVVPTPWLRRHLGYVEVTTASSDGTAR